MKRLSAILALIFIACTGWAAVDYPVTIPFTNSAAFTNVGPRAILARVTISVVTPQAATATVSIVSAGVTNQILSHASTSFRVAHWPPSSASTNTFLESNDIVRVTCSAAGQAYAVIDAVVVGSTEVPAPLLIVDGNNTTSQPTVLKFSGSAQTDLGGGRWLIIQNSSTTLLEKAEAALLYATTQDMAAANANIDQEVLDREADVLDLQQFASALLNTQIQHKAIMDGFDTNLTITTDRANSNVTESAILAARIDSNSTFNAATYAPKSTALTSGSFWVNGQAGTSGAQIVISTLDTNAPAWMALTGSVGQAKSTANEASSTGTAAYALAVSANTTATGALSKAGGVMHQGSSVTFGTPENFPLGVWTYRTNLYLSPALILVAEIASHGGGQDLIVHGSDTFTGSNGGGDLVLRAGKVSNWADPGGDVIISGATVRVYGQISGDGTGVTNVNAARVGNYLPTDFALLTTLTTGGYFRATSGAVTSNSMTGARGEFRRTTTNAYFHDGSQWVTWSVSTNFTH